MQKIFLFIGFIFSVFILNAQTFNGTGGAIPGSSTVLTCFTTNVSGVGNINDVSNGLTGVCINITHPNDDELEILLKAPDGTVIPLSIQNGGSGNNYTNTCFSNSAASSIKFGLVPFTGSFIPEGYLGAANNGQNADGTWSLCIQDRRTAANAGSLVNWSLTFSNTPAPLPPAIPACANTLPSTSSCATATAVCDFDGLCGSTAGSSVQNWTGSGLTGCFGLQNNSFIKFIASASTAAFTVWVPTNSGGPLGGIQMLFFSGTCDAGAVTTHGCYPHIFPYQSSSIPLATIITANGLVPGNTYYLMFDGFNNDISTFRIAAKSGVNFLNLNPAAPAICTGQGVNITASGSDGPYSWTPGTGLNTTTGAVVTASPTISTIYTVSSTTSSGCNLTKDVTVTVNAPPAVTTHPLTDTQRVCQNGPVTPFSIAATAGSGTISSYQWYINTMPNNFGGTLLPFANLSTFTPSTSSTGTLYFYCKVTNSNGCTDTSNVSGPLIISPAVNTPTATATVQPTCLAPTGTIVVTAPAGLNIQYSIGGTYQAFGTFSGLAPDSSYNVTAKNIVTGCISNIKVVPVNALPAGPATPVAAVTVQPTCLAPTGTIVVSSPFGPTIEYSIGGVYQSGTSFSGLTNGTTYKITAKDIITGCVSDTFSLAINTIPGAPAAPTASVTTQPDCNTTTGTITVTAPTGATIEYSVGGTYQASGLFTSLTPGTTYAVTAKDNVSGCVSAPLNLTVDTIASATAPVVTSPVAYCQNATAVALTASGSNLLWYSTLTGGAGTATAPVPSTLTTGSTDYFVSQTSGICESPRATITVNVTAQTAAPVVTSPVTYCQNETTASLTATGTSLLWYTVSSGGTGSSTAPTPLSAAAGSIIYYVSQTISSCESPRSAITVTVNATPAAPTVSSPVAYCENATATALTATGTNLLWYTTLTGGVGTSTAPVPATTTTGNTIYYVSQTVNNCEGPRAAITVTVNAIPPAPTVTSPVIYCQNATATALTATGTNLLWYTTLTGGVGTSSAPVPVTTATGNTIYYVSQTLSGCEGPRAVITVTVSAVPLLPTVASPVIYCQNETATTLTATGTSLLWYTTISGGVGSSLAPTPSTTTGGNTNYYVTQTVNGCEGPRASIAVTITPTPAAPTVSSPVSYCQNATAAALTATGTNLLWYTTLIGGVGNATEPAPVTTVAGSVIYYVSQTVSSCEGPRAAITVTVNATPPLPSVNNLVTYCQNATAVALTATGTNLLWYTTLTGGTGTSTAPVPVTTTTGNTIYYVSQTVNGCEGPRAAIRVAVTVAPGVPVVASPLTYCQNTTPPALTAIGTNLFWYTTASGGVGSSSAPVPSSTSAGNTNYYVSQTVSGCEGPRASITVTINPIPAAPTVSSPVNYCQNATATALTATGTNLYWYMTLLPGGLGTAVAPVPVTTAAGSVIYYVSQTINNCEGPRASITVTVNATPALPTVSSPVVYCQNTTASALTATGNNLLWYTTASGGVGAATAPTPSTATAGNTIYYVSQTVNNCEGPRAAITVTIIAGAVAPTVISPVTYCQNAIPVALTANGTNLLWYLASAGGTGSAVAPVPSTGTPGNTFYFVTQTINGCESPRRAITVTINAVSTAISGFRYNPDTVCINSNNPGPVYDLGFTNGGTFTSVPAGLSINPSTGNINLAATSTGSYTVTYTYNTTGCVTGSSASSPVTILPAVSTVTVFSYTSPVCKNAPDPGPNKRAGFTEGGSYSAGLGLVINPATGIIDVANSAPGAYQVTYNIPALGCRLATSNFSFITIIDTTSPVTEFSYSPNNVCISSGTNPTLVKAAGFTTSGGVFSAVPAGLSINSTTGNINIGLSVPGVYTITYNVPSFICRLAGTYTTTFTIAAYASPVTGFSYTSPVCKGDGMAIPVTATGFFNGGVFSSTTGLGIDAATGVIDLTQSIAGNYIIKYDVAPGVCNPAGSGTAPINVLTQPAPPVVSPVSICGAGIVNLTATALGTVGWYTEPALLNQVNAGNSYTTLLNSTTLFYITNTVGSCASEAAILNATVNPIPVAPFLGRDTAICSTDKLVLNASGPYNSYLWQDGSTQPTISVTNTGNYKVMVSTGTGCGASSSININVLDNCDDIYFPTAFTPNGDGLNDKFGPAGNLFLVKNYSLKVFNRYGETVFISSNPYERWDGSFRGKQNGPNNYVWVSSYIYHNRVTKTQKGNLTIVQ